MLEICAQKNYTDTRFKNLSLALKKIRKQVTNIKNSKNISDRDILSWSLLIESVNLISLDNIFENTPWSKNDIFNCGDSNYDDETSEMLSKISNIILACEIILNSTINKKNN